MAGHSETRAVAVDEAGTLAVFDPWRTRTVDGVVMAAEVNGHRRYTCGPVTDCGKNDWVQIGDSLYPKSTIQILGRVLFIIAES
jgi:hypothetical protein